MTVRIINFRLHKNDSVNVVAEFGKVTSCNTLEYPLISFISSFNKCECTMKVPDDCYLIVEKS
jgi:hypothetical protein